MPGPPPKPAAQRRRRNRSSTAVVLSAPTGRPTLPPLKKLMSAIAWHPMVEAWWADLASSPMASEYDRTDMHGLVMLARLHQQFWTAETETALLEAHREIRLRSPEYGLSPLSRRRLQWEIERGEEAQAKTAARKASTSKRRVDPRLKEA